MLPPTPSTFCSTDKDTDSLKSIITGDTTPVILETPATRNPFYFFRKSDIWLLVPALIANALCAATDVANTILVQRLFSALTDFQIGKYSSKYDFLHQITWPVAGIVLVGLGSTLLGWAETSLFTYLGERQQVRCRHQLYESLLARDLSYFQTTENLDGDLIQLNRSVEEFRSSISECLSILCKTVFSIIALLIISMIYSWKLTLLIFSVIPVIILSILIFGGKVSMWAKHEDDNTANALSLLNWNFSSYQWVKIVYSQNIELEKYNQILNTCETAFRNFSIYANTVAGIMRAVSLLIFVQSFWFGSFLIRHGQGEGSKIIAAFYSCLKLSMMISSLSMLAVIFQKANTSYKKVVKFLQITEEIETFNKPLFVPESQLKGDFILKSVNFRYTDEDSNILKNVSMKIHSGKTTYLVGKSGSGKSTIASLLLKLYKPNSGRITVDGFDLEDVDTKWLRQNITLVQQFPQHFNDTIQQNILLGTPYNDITTEVVDAIDYFNLTTVINELPHGLETIIGKGDDTIDAQNGENPVQLSGGQEQRLNLVRAKLRDSSVLILDESISALDISQRKLFMNKINNWRKGKTTIIITHELDHIQDNDYVYFMELGRVVESALKKELVDSSGKFSHLQEQAKKSVSKGDNRKSLFFDIEKEEDIEKNVLIMDKNISAATTEKKEELSNIRAPILIAYKLLIRFTDTKYKLLYICGLLLVLANAILTPVFSFCFAQLINGIIPKGDGNLIDNYEQVKWSMIATSIALATGITTFASSTILQFVAERLCKNLQNKALEKILKQDIQFFEMLNTNEISTLLMNDIRDFRMIFSANLSRLLSGITISLVCIIWTLTLGWKYALVGFSMFPLFALGSLFGTAIMQKTEFAYKNRVVKTENIAYETSSNMKTIMCFNLQQYFIDKFDNSLKFILSAGKLRSIAMGISINIVLLITNVAQAIMLYYGFKLVANGEYTLVNMMQIVMMILMSVGFLSELMSSAPGLYRGLRVALKLNKILELPDNAARGYLTPNFSNNQTGEAITFVNTTFSYPANKTPVFENLNLTIKAHHITAIIGESGCGKSTLLSLILRLYSANGVLVDGYDINTIKLSHWLANVAVVTQKHYFIDASIRDNLLYAVPNKHAISDEEILNLLEKLDLASLSLDDDLSVSGNLTVSGGQAQRLSIARAILRHPSLLILDEPTSSLDAASTTLVLDLLTEIKDSGVTILIITHQQKVMWFADEVITLGDGGVLNIN
ncbi:hypothetical protein CANINC_004949 [Pichia inconspicua]|uniref:Uncharacterized protein n=1 Tax=Pichia inconspicua TaxID=52247 RepID=A0A4T0WUJ7_9ASCO|nr:hypothetical protein CANINC_004949 [[Candida] inconspicua]